MPRPFYICLAAFAGTLLIAINPIGDLESASRLVSFGASLPMSIIARGSTKNR